MPLQLLPQQVNILQTIFPELETIAMFETAMFIDTFETLVKNAHTNSKNKGFWGALETSDTPPFTSKPINPTNVGEKLMLMVSELSEAFEAYRKNIADAPCDKDCVMIDPTAKEPVTVNCPDCAGTGLTSPHHPPMAHCSRCAGAKTLTVEGYRRLTNMEEEMADVVIRVADFCGYLGIDLGRCILAKMAYNKQRPHLHGGKLC